MIDVLIFASQRPVVITLAITGALLVTAGSLIAKPRGKGDVSRRWGKEPSDHGQSLLAQRLTKVGYAVTLISIALFIVAGFVSDLRP